MIFEKSELLGSCNRNFAEFLEIFHKFESGLASACAGSLVSLNSLSLSIYLECCNFFIDFCNESFHNDFWVYVIISKKVILTKVDAR